MRLSKIRPGRALLLATLMLSVSVVVHAAPQWSGIKGRAWVEQMIIAPPLTNVVGVPAAPESSSAFNVVPFRSPIKTVIRIYAAKSGRLVRTVNTDDSGRFVALLQPGLYRLEPASIWDGHVLGPGQAITMDMSHVIQTAPVQTVRVSGFRYADVTVVYHTVWPVIRQIPYRSIRLAPVPGPAHPVGNVPPPQPGGSVISSGSLSTLSGRTFPPLPPAPLSPPDSPPRMSQLPPPLPQR